MIRAALIVAWMLLAAGSGHAREAAFVDPSVGTTRGPTSEALIAEPKELDTGESVVGVSRRTTLFFNNLSGLPVTISNVTLNFDSNVVAEITSDDCQKLGKIPSGNRCAMALTINPNSPGPWTVEILVTHDGAGRISRALVNGITLGERKQSQENLLGLALSSTKIDPVDFGEIEVGIGAAVRSALVFNDSTEDLTISSIDVIAPPSGLERLETGCEMDMTLKTGQSCPITVRWAPAARGTVSTDIIVRHSGRTGFMVIPLRGKATGGTDVAEPDEDDTGKSGKGKKSEQTSRSERVSETSNIPTPPSESDVEKLAAAMPKIGSEDLKKESKPEEVKKEELPLALVGTVGQRVILRSGETDKLLGPGQEMVWDDYKIKLIGLKGRVATLDVDGNQRELKLQLSGPQSVPGGGEETLTDGTAGASSGKSSGNTESSATKRKSNSSSAPVNPITGAP